MERVTDQQWRNHLAYLAVYYAIQGDGGRAEWIRRLLRRLNSPVAARPRGEKLGIAGS